MSEEEPNKSVEDQKSINTSRSTQFRLRTWQAWLEQSEFVEAEKKPIQAGLYETRTFPASEAFLLYLWFQKFLQTNFLTAEVNI